MLINGIEIEVIKKKIKNMYIHVRRDGSVLITAPMRVSKRDIIGFAASKTEWIREKQRIAQTVVSTHRELSYVTGEQIFLWGKIYTLILRDNSGVCDLSFAGDNCFLSMKNASTPAERKSFVREQYRALLVEKINVILPQIEVQTALECNLWRTKYMKTRWGTCNTVKKCLWFNVRLAQKPPECLEYVVLHELAHTVVPNHGKDFVAIMDKFMPQWREVKKRLNAPEFSI